MADQPSAKSKKLVHDRLAYNEYMRSYMKKRREQGKNVPKRTTADVAASTAKNRERRADPDALEHIPTGTDKRDQRKAVVHEVAKEQAAPDNTAAMDAILGRKFKLTAKQNELNVLLGGDATHIMAFGGSRSGKTFGLCRALAIRAMTAPGSRHAILRFRFNHAKASIIDDTFPKMMALCFPGAAYHLDKTWWFYEFPNKSQIWIGGLDDKERTEKILGQEHVTIFFNECSQIPFESVNLALTRLAQLVTYKVKADRNNELVEIAMPMRPRAFYDCNPPKQSHWVYQQFIQKRDPSTRKALGSPDDYVSMQMNPVDNKANLAKAYLQMLESQPAHIRERFLHGRFGSLDENALFNSEVFEKWRSISDTLPDMQRIVVAVDPSGSGDTDNAHNDAIGIVVAGLGTDGNGYLLEDLTVKAGPKVWGNIVATAFDRHEADLVVGETNYGGEMVKFVVQAAKPGISFHKVTASRGKVVRAEPVSALVEQGKIRHVGTFLELEEELCAFTTNGYVGSGSPNRGDAYVWAFAALFPGIVREKVKTDDTGGEVDQYLGPDGWMAA